MAYNGPSSGSLNVIPLTAIATRGSTKPTIDTGSDGDYALDVNTGLLYGPKDASNTDYPWPVAGSINQGLIWRGSWGYPASYNPGDIVSDSGNQYLCIKPIIVYPQTNVDQYTAGSWSPGDTVTTTDATINGLYMCISATSLTPSNPSLQLLPAASQPWLLYSPSKDWTAVTGSGTFAQKSGALGNWVKLDSTIAVNSTGLSDGDYCSLSVQAASITTAKLADGSVTSAKIVNGTIATADIADGAITQPLLGSGAVGETNISQYLTTATASPSAYFPASKIVSAGTTVSGTAISTTNPAMDAAGSFWYSSRTSNVSTLPAILATSGAAPANQEAFAAKATCLATGNYDKIRCRFTTAGSSLTDVRLCVWNTSGTVLAYSGNLVTSGAVSTTFSNTTGLALNTTLALTLGTKLWLGLVAYGATSPTMPNAQAGSYTTFALADSMPIATTGSVNSEMMTYSRTSTGWTGGTSIPTLTSGGAKFGAPWVELIGA